MRLALADLNFHGTIYQLAGDDLLARVWRETLAGRLRLLVNVTSHTHAPIGEEVENHQRILDTISQGDLEAAQIEVGRHIHESWARIRKVVQCARADAGPASAGAGLTSRVAGAGK
jgi:DNA-binding GntR family transcriptional regulator